MNFYSVIITEKKKMAKILADSIFEKSEVIRVNEIMVGYSGILDGRTCLISFTDGHLYELETPEQTSWALDELPFKVPTKYSIDKRKVVLGAYIHKAIGKCERLILACDPDPQGSYIADLVRRMSGYRGDAIMGALNSTDPDQIREQYKSIDSMEKFSRYLPVASSEACRARIDNHLGINLTRLFTILGRSKSVTKLNAVLAIGRIQTSILGIVARRHYEIENFKPEKFHVFHVDLQLESGEVITMEVDTHRVFSEDEKDKILNEIKSHPLEIIDIASSRKYISPPEPFKQSTLQVHMGKLYNISPSDVLKASASNYESGFQSYPRTDGNDIEYKAWFNAENILSQTLEDVDFSELNFKRMGKTVLGEGVKPNAAHTAIIPTGKEWTGPTTGDNYLVFKEVVKRFSMMFMDERIIEKTKIVAKCGPYTLTATGEVEIQEGWYKHESLKPKTKNKTLPVFTYETSFSSSAYTKLSTTRSPSRYQQHEIIEELENIGKHIPESHQELSRFFLADENSGLGSSATRAPAIEKTIKHGILKIDASNKYSFIVPTKIGLALFNALPYELTDLTIFAEWERDFIHIRNRQKRMSDVLTENGKFVDNIVHKYVYNRDLFNFKPPVVATGYECPHCYSVATMLSGKYGNYWVCANKTECGKTIPDYKGAPLEILKGDGTKCQAAECAGTYRSFASMTKKTETEDSRPYRCLKCDTCNQKLFNYK